MERKEPEDPSLCSLRSLRFNPAGLGKAAVFLAAVAVLWLLVALFLRKKGKPLSLPPFFWIVAGIPVVFLVGLLALATIAWATSDG